MAVSLKHAFNSPKGDGPDASVVRPSNWNAEHALTLTGPAVLGKPGAGNGPAVEMPAGAFGQQVLAAADQNAFNGITGALPTGAMMMFCGGLASITGWVRANGLTISSLAGAGTERHTADCKPLFVHLYNSFPDTVCPVSGGRSGNAVNDFVANKTLRLPDLRGKQFTGDDVMGNAAANVNPGGTLGVTGGAPTHAIAQANLPAVAIPITTSTDPGGAHTQLYDRTSRTAKVVQSGTGATINEADPVAGTQTGISPTHIHAINGNTNVLGSGTALPTMDPYFVGFYYIKL
jgi:microcystin-dependent protein